MTTAEVQELRLALQKAQEQLRVQAQAAAAAAISKVKDLMTANLIDAWRGDGPVSVTEFFDNVDRAAKITNWTEADKVSILKLKGISSSLSKQ